MNVKSPYHINPAYDPYSLQSTEYPITNYMNEPINNTIQYPTVEYPDVSNILYFYVAVKTLENICTWGHE